jgi:hypothetical protein
MVERRFSEDGCDTAANRDRKRARGAPKGSPRSRLVEYLV